MAETEPVQATIAIGNSKIRYLFYEGSGPPLVLLHATGFNPWLWHPIARKLNAAFRIFCPFFCDHREAAPEAGGVGWRLLAEDLAAFCKALEISRPFMAGHSMGGAIMAIAAGKLGLMPAGMVLIEPIMLPEDLYGLEIGVKDHPMARKAINRRNKWRDADEVRRYLRSRPLFKNWDDQMLELYIQYGMTAAEGGGLELTCSPRKEAALFMGSMDDDPWSGIPGVHCPVLVLEGAHTENKGFIDFRRAAGMFPQGRYQQVPDVGHLIPMEAPDQTAALIFSFFRIRETHDDRLGLCLPTAKGGRICKPGPLLKPGSLS